MSRLLQSLSLVLGLTPCPTGHTHRPYPGPASRRGRAIPVELPTHSIVRLRVCWRIKMRLACLLSLLATIFFNNPATAQDWTNLAERRTFELQDFTFHNGETLPSVTMSVYTLGELRRDEAGNISDAVLLLHGTGGSGLSLLRPSFGDQLFGPGQPLDIERYYIISPDNLGHGDSSKPSDGLRAAFPRYDYDDMVLAQYRVLTDGLQVRQLEMIVGTSMGCMHSFMWGVDYPRFARRLVTLACNAIEIAGQNLMLRQMVIDGFENDPAYVGLSRRQERLAVLH